LRVVDPTTYGRIEKKVVRQKIKMNYDEAKVFLRDFVGALREVFRKDYIS